MSKGAKIVNVRMSDEMIADMDSAMAAAWRRTRDGAPDRSEWIRRAVEDKLRHLARSRRSVPLAEQTK